VTRMRAGLMVLILPAFLATGAQASSGVLADTGTTGATGAQTATTCPTPKLKVPKRPLFTNATVKFKLTNMTKDAGYVIKAGNTEVWGGAAAGATVKGQFLMPYQGAKDSKTSIAAVIDLDACENAPWKIQKKVEYQAATTPAAATPTTPATPATPPPAAVTPAKPTPTPTPTPIKPVKLPKPITQRLPDMGPKPGLRAWLPPTDGGSRIEQRIEPPKLGRLERKADEASSTHALVGIAIVFVLFAIATVAALAIFRRRDEIQFERALGEQLKHLEEGDPGLEFADQDPSTEPIPAAEVALFAAPAAEAAAATEAAPPAELPAEAPTEVPIETPAEAPTEALPQPVAANGTNGTPAEHRAEVEAELQRVLDDAGLQAELQGILAEARSEAERQGIAIDTDVMLQALIEEINGSTELSDAARTQLRSKFEQIIAAETERVPAP
jgi:hypothetical protein